MNDNEVLIEYGKIPRRFTLTLDPALAQRVEYWRREMGVINMSEAVRALTRVALSALPEDGLIEARQAEAFNRVRHWTQTRTAEFFRDLATQLSESASISTLGGSLIK